MAISFQLFPASLIVLSRRSSAGVQGVFVRLFLVAVGLGVGSFRPAAPVSSSPGASYPCDGPAVVSVIMGVPAALRFREAGAVRARGSMGGKAGSGTENSGWVMDKDGWRSVEDGDVTEEEGLAYCFGGGGALRG